MKAIYSIGLMVLIAVLFMVGCSSTPPAPDVPVMKETERDYIVRDRNPEPAPDWFRDFSKFKRDIDGKGMSYFMGESGDVSDRIAGCSMADLEGRKKIAQLIAYLITSKIATSRSGMLVIDKDNPNDPGLRHHYEEQLAGKTLAFLSGTKEYGVYWEERDYSKVGGKRRVYNCAVALSIDDKSLTEALRRAAQKTTEVIEDKEAKAAVKEALKDIDVAFKEYSSKR